MLEPVQCVSGADEEEKRRKGRKLVGKGRTRSRIYSTTAHGLRKQEKGNVEKARKEVRASVISSFQKGEKKGGGGGEILPHPYSPSNTREGGEKKGRVISFLLPLFTWGWGEEGGGEKERRTREKNGSAGRRRKTSKVFFHRADWGGSKRRRKRERPLE